jgi:hypothetical protein
MKTRQLVVILCLLTVWIGGCGTRQINVPEETSSSQVPASSGLFVETDETREVPLEPQIVRMRFVKVDLNQLLDESGKPREVKEVSFNLFPDVVYTGVIEETKVSGDNVTWSGILKDVENSYFTMVFTSGVFMGHFGSPQGIYEVIYWEDLYWVVMIDQSKLPGGEG